MFEVGFSEIILILGLALLVLGPERLPELAAKVGRWTGRARAMARQFQAQLEQEVALDEARKTPAQQSTTPHYPDTAALTDESHDAPALEAIETSADPTAAPTPTPAGTEAPKQ